MEPVLRLMSYKQLAEASVTALMVFITGNIKNLPVRSTHGCGGTGGSPGAMLSLRPQL